MHLPPDFISYTSQLFGEELWGKYVSSFDQETPVSIRLCGNTTLEDVAHLPIESRIPWSSQGYYLSERPVFTLDPLLHAGAYYVQEASSQYLDQVLKKATEGLQINYAADFCAAPGGKSLIIRDNIPPTATLITNEIVRKRAWILAENMEKSQLPNPRVRSISFGTQNQKPKTIITNNSTSDIARSGYTFDLIVCDVPCSGEGMFRKDHATIKEWSIENVMKCAQLQREIVTNAWECLRPGGVLVYSTCTFNRYEDEDNMDYIVHELGAEIIVQPRKFIPGQDRGEGQFMVAFRKKNHPDGTLPPFGDSEGGSHPPRSGRAGVGLNILPPTMEEIPADAPVCSVPLADAQNYLRGNSITLPPDTPKGIVAIAYKGFVLGTAKNIGSRANNRYPKEWRIKHL